MPSHTRLYICRQNREAPARQPTVRRAAPRTPAVANLSLIDQLFAGKVTTTKASLVVAYPDIFGKAIIEQTQACGRLQHRIHQTPLPIWVLPLLSFQLHLKLADQSCIAQLEDLRLNSTCDMTVCVLPVSTMALGTRLPFTRAATRTIEIGEVGEGLACKTGRPT